jgi:hypothetical protein
MRVRRAVATFAKSVPHFQPPSLNAQTQAAAEVRAIRGLWLGKRKLLTAPLQHRNLDRPAIQRLVRERFEWT